MVNNDADLQSLGAITRRVETLRRTGITGFLAVGPYPPPFGGIASNLKDLGLIFGPRGFQLHVLMFTNDSETRDVPDTGVLITRGKARFSLAHLRAMIRNPFGLVRAFAFWVRTARSSGRMAGSAFLRAARVAAAADESDMSIVSIYGTPEGSIVPFLRRLRPGLRIIYWIYASPFIEPDMYRTHYTLYSTAARDADLIAATSKYCASAVAVMQPEKEAEVVYVGVDLDRFNPAVDAAKIKRKLGLGSPKVVMFLGRMEPAMGAANALSIAQDLVSRRDDITFLICGATGSLTQQIVDEAANSDGRIKAFVDVPFDELPQLYAASDIVIAPTVGAHACMGVSVKEAMASGKPTVVSDSGGLPEAIQDGAHGHIIPLLSSGQVDNVGFATRIDELIDQPERLTNMGLAARDRAEAVFSSEASAMGLLRLITKTTGQ